MEEMSILITNEAKRELDKLLENSDKTCIRILTRHITMTTEAKIDLELDEPNANDNCYDVDGYKVIINKVLDSQMNYITISYGGLLSRNAFCVEADFNFYYKLFKASTNLSISSFVLKYPIPILRLPLSFVLITLCAVGAQCSPALSIMSYF